MQGDASRDRPVDRVTVAEAAELLGVTQSAVRKRIQRGTIPWDRDGEGRIYVYVDPSETRLETGRDKSRDTLSGQALVAELRDHIHFLRSELERKDALLMSLMRRIPELEAPSEPREAPEGDGSGDATRAQEPEKRRSWLWRFFFGP